MKIENGKYGKTVISCIAANGICHRKQECSDCFHADKYEFRMKLFELAGECDFKKEAYCSRFERDCKAEDCRILLCKIESLN